MMYSGPQDKTRVSRVFPLAVTLALAGWTAIGGCHIMHQAPTSARNHYSSAGWPTSRSIKLRDIVTSLNFSSGVTNTLTRVTVIL
ncbi:hypothetical protein EDB86DRAFT_2908405 [Lactarius hatsudake]|nr:hypothetical protein EDB86DRAFT_2908405 [Lactarius hatsudake]